MTVRPLLLLHGALGSSAQFTELRGTIRDMAGNAVALDTLDFDGHGEAGVFDGAFRPARFVENLRDALDRMGMERPSVFGYSMGGYVALCLAAEEPDRLGRVMTLGTKFRWTPEAAEREGRMLDAGKIREKVPQFAQALEARHPAGWERVLDRTREMMVALGDAPDLDDAALASVSIPVRIAVGDRDATVSVEESAEVSRLLPRGELQVLPATPHPLEKVSVRRLARAILEFIA